MVATVLTLIRDLLKDGLILFCDAGDVEIQRLLQTSLPAIHQKLWIQNKIPQSLNKTILIIYFDEKTVVPLVHQIHKATYLADNDRKTFCQGLYASDRQPL